VVDRGVWTAAPEPPRHYQLRDRWLDSRNGRADARAGIPEVGPEVGPEPMPDAAAGLPLEGATPPPFMTPYLDGLRNARNQEIAGELHRYETSQVRLRGQLFQAEVRRASLAYAMEYAATRLGEVSVALTEQQLTRRGRAERDEQKWPEEMLRERRERTHRLSRLEAQDELRKVTAELRVADLAVEHAHIALEEHFRIAQAAAWAIAHYYGRREAVYLRSLARGHKNGPAVVKMLDLVGTQLPEWLLRTEKEGS
jgi:hypothetical protein